MPSTTSADTSAAILPTIGTEKEIGVLSACSQVLGVVGIGVTACRNESVCRIIRAGDYAICEHIAIHIVRYGVAIEHYKSVVGIISEAAAVRAGNIACGIVAKGLGRDDHVTTDIPDGS